jgi:hypothetical protein
MKIKLLFFLLFSVSSFVSNGQVIFDPATYPQDSLPAGMTLDTIDGTVYVQIILNEWSSFIKINPSVAINENATHFRTVARLGTGVSGFQLAKINTFLKLVDPNWTELAAAGSASSATLAKYQVKIAKIDQVGYIQVAGQETTNWSAIKGDTLWLGKVTAVEVDPQTIFDPAVYDPDLLPAGASIVEIDSVKYCQIILNNGFANISTFPYTIGNGTIYIRTKVKYGGGVSGTELSKISVQIDLSSPDGTNLTPATITSLASPEWSVYKKPINKGPVGFLKVGAALWNGTYVMGDTVWIGKVRAVDVEPGVIFDPAQCDPAELPAGMKIVSLGGTKYLKALLNSWSSFIPVDPINATDANTHFSADAKYAVGSSGFELNNINTFLKLATADWTELGAGGSASSTEFKKYSVAIPTKGMVANFQFAGQEKTNWNAVTGDTLWIGKLFFEDMAAPTAPGNLAANVDTSTVKLTWDASTDNASISGYEVSQDGVVLDTVKTKNFKVTGLADGTYTFSVMAIDASGNHSVASSVDAVVFTASPNSVHNLNAERIKIYPNPVSSILYVNRVRNILEINVINMTGSVLRTVHNTNAVDVANLREGLYLLQVKTSSGVLSATFIKE